MLSCIQYDDIIRNLIERHHYEFPKIDGFYDRELTTFDLSNTNRVMYIDLWFGYRSDLYIIIQMGRFRFFLLWYGTVKDFKDLRDKYNSSHYTRSKILEIFIIQNLGSCTSFDFNEKYKLK